MAGPPTMRPLRASLSVQGALRQLGPTLLGWGSCQELGEKGSPPSHSTTSFHLTHIYNLIWHHRSLLLLPSQALPPRRPCRTAAGNETALLRSFFLKTEPGRDAGSISCTPSEACPGQSSPHEGRTRATRPGCTSSVSETTSLRCQQESHSVDRFPQHREMQRRLVPGPGGVPYSMASAWAPTVSTACARSTHTWLGSTAHPQMSGR